jgi:hypothetical protein
MPHRHLHAGVFAIPIHRLRLSLSMTLAISASLAASPALAEDDAQG